MKDIYIDDHHDDASFTHVYLWRLAYWVLGRCKSPEMADMLYCRTAPLLVWYCTISVKVDKITPNTNKYDVANQTALECESKSMCIHTWHNARWSMVVVSIHGHDLVLLEEHAARGLANTFICIYLIEVWYTGIADTATVIISKPLKYGEALNMCISTRAWCEWARNIFQIIILRTCVTFTPGRADACEHEYEYDVMGFCKYNRQSMIKQL